MCVHFSALSAGMCLCEEAETHAGPHPAVVVIGMEKPGTEAANVCAVFIFIISP